jgi:preprotein translocase subunit YajC
MLRLMALLLSAAPLTAQEGIIEVIQAPETNFLQSIALLVVMVLFLYFIVWRPEKRRRAALEAQRSAMQVGDKVVAIGIVGTVDSIAERTVILKMIDGSKLEVLKAAITEVQGKCSGPKEGCSACK